MSSHNTSAMIRCSASFTIAASALSTLLVANAPGAVVTNGLGVGRAAVAVWKTGNKPPALADHSFATGVGLAPFAFAGPNLAGCNPLTKVTANSNGLANQNWSVTGVAATGDWGSADGADLLPWVTPTSQLCTGTVNVSATPAGSQMQYAGSISLSDSGAAARIQIMDMTSPNGVLLLEILSMGEQNNYQFNESVKIPAGGLSLLETRVDLLVSSVPEPATAGGLITASMLTLRRRRRQPQ